MWFNDTLAVAFGVGLVIIYLPQYYKIWKRKSSEGFSIWFMFLGHTAAWISWVNAIIFYLPFWWTCHKATDCTEGFLAFGLIIHQWFLYWIQYVMFLRYYPRVDEEHKKEYKLLVVTFIGSHLISLTCLATTLLLFRKYEFSHKSKLNNWSSILDVAISIMFLSHYIPQVYQTIKLKTVGSISLVTLGVMCPGTFVWTAFLALQGSITGNKNAGELAVWLPYLLVAISMLTLLLIGIYYEYGNYLPNGFHKCLPLVLRYEPDHELPMYNDTDDVLFNVDEIMRTNIQEEGEKVPLLSEIIEIN